MDEGVQLARVLGGQILTDIQILDGTANPGVVLGCIETVDHADTTAAGLDGLPGGPYIVTDRRHHPQAGDNNPSFAHIRLYLT